MVNTRGDEWGMIFLCEPQWLDGENTYTKQRLKICGHPCLSFWPIQYLCECNIQREGFAHEPSSPSEVSLWSLKAGCACRLFSSMAWACGGFHNFHSHGSTPVIIHFRWGFSLINHPAIGVPPWLWKPPQSTRSLFRSWHRHWAGLLCRHDGTDDAYSCRWCWCQWRVMCCS